MEKPVVYNFDDPVDYLNNLISYLRSIDESFSLNQFSKTLDISYRKLRNMMKRKTPLELEVIQKIADTLGIDPSDAHYIKTLIKYTNAKEGEEREYYAQTLHQLSPNQKDFRCLYDTTKELYSSWLPMALLALISVGHIKDDSDYISGLFNFTVNKDEVQSALEILFKKNLIRKTSDDLFLEVTYHKIATTSDKKVENLYPFYTSVNELAKEAVDMPLDEREFQVFTTIVERDKMHILKKVLRDTRREISKISQPQPDQSLEGASIYQISLQAFPLTQTIRPTKQSLPETQVPKIQ